MQIAFFAGGNPGKRFRFRRTAGTALRRNEGYVHHLPLAYRFSPCNRILPVQYRHSGLFLYPPKSSSSIICKCVCHHDTADQWRMRWSVASHNCRCQLSITAPGLLFSEWFLRSFLATLRRGKPDQNKGKSWSQKMRHLLSQTAAARLCGPRFADQFSSAWLAEGYFPVHTAPLILPQQ